MYTTVHTGRKYIEDFIVFNFSAHFANPLISCPKVGNELKLESFQFVDFIAKSLLLLLIFANED